MAKEYKTTIGLEVHLQLSTRTKAFCGCVNQFGKEANTAVCPVCLGFPGSLPVLNREYLRNATKVALALHCKVADRMKFDRKNYFYPDLPKNYQISQYDMPLSSNGFVMIAEGDQVKRIGITRVHMEEDAGKLIHDEAGLFSLVDFNRSGTPLLEIVSEPDMDSPQQAYCYLTTLKAILEYLDVSDCNMQEGSLRCDANISVAPKGDNRLGAKVELKNMNTFKGVRLALEYEQKRQVKLLSGGEKVIQQTRLWDEHKKTTELMRTKEEAHDYRYFPEPDLVPFKIDASVVEEIRKTIPEMPSDKRTRFIRDYKISDYDAGVIVADKSMSEYFEETIGLGGDPKSMANWLLSDVLRYMNAHEIEFKLLAVNMPAKALVDMQALIDNATISGKMAKDLVCDIMATGKSPAQIVKDKAMVQITDAGEIEIHAAEVIADNPDIVKDYLSGNEKVFGFLVGQLMKRTKGKANPKLANRLLKKRLDKEKR